MKIYKNTKIFALLLICLMCFTGCGMLSNRTAAPKNDASNSNTATASKTAEIKDYTVMRDKADELAALSPTLKLDANQKLKGKIAVVESQDGKAKMYGFNDSFSEIEENMTYGLKREIMAKTPDEIDTLIQILCKKGKPIAQYEKNATGFSNDCKVSLIDYKNKVAFAQKSLSNNKSEEKISEVYKNNEYVVLPPIDKIDDFVRPFIPEKIEVSQSNPADLPQFEEGESFGRKAGEKLGQLSFPVKLDENAKIKGKVTVIEDNHLIGIDLEGNIQPELPSAIILTKESLGFANNQMATKTSEIDTLIQVNCKKGSLLSKIKGISVYSNVCEVNIIDYKAGAFVAQKTFEGKEINKSRYDDPSIYDDKQDVVVFPRKEIEEYIKSFPKQ